MTVQVFKKNLVLNYCYLLAFSQDSMDVETTNPSMWLSFPHVVVGTLSSFLFGYHLGFVCYLKLSSSYFLVI